jgi:hypothetical protein
MTSRIKGPSDGPPRVGTVTGSEAPSGAKEIAGAAATGASPPAAPAIGGEIVAGDAVARVAAGLRAGEVTVEQAVDLLIEDAITRQLGRAGEARAQVEEELRELLRTYAANDPLLAGKIRRLTLSK